MTVLYEPPDRSRESQGTRRIPRPWVDWVCPECRSWIKAGSLHRHG